MTQGQGGTIVPCPKCGFVGANRGLQGLHVKRCQVTQAAPVNTLIQTPTVPTPAPERKRAWKLEEVCNVLEEGLELETACDNVRADISLYHEAMRRVAINDAKTTPEEREAVARIKQAKSAFERDLYDRLSNPADKQALDAASRLAIEIRERVKKRPLEFEYNAMILLDVVKRHVDVKQYRQILGDLCEIDPELSVLALDSKIIGMGDG